MKSANKLFAATILAAATSFSATASAEIFGIDYADAGVWHSYDSDNQAYAMKFRTDQEKDGFWLVVTDGDNPKGDGSSHAILYGDLVENRITAYTYTGENNSSSYESGELLGTYENVFSSGGTHPTLGYDMTMFSLDVSSINSAGPSSFKGVGLGEKAGIWFHQSADSEFSYDADGAILDYAFDGQMWLDRGNDDITFIGASPECTPTTEIDIYLDSCDSTQLVGGIPATGGGGGSVPAPGGLALVLVGFAAFVRRFRFFKA